MQPINEDITILQGATFTNALQWFGSDPVHKIITAVAIGLPTLVTAAGHGLTIGQRTPVWITNVKGPRDLNTAGYKDCEPRWASAIDADTLAIDYDSGGDPAYQSGGVLTYYTPVDLTGYTAREQFRASVTAPDVLLELSTTNGGITLDPATGTVTRQISAADTAALTWSQCVRDLDLTDAGGIVTRLSEGTAIVERGVTR